MRVLIDADGCPVVDEAIRAAREFQIECLLLCDTSHRFERAGATTLTLKQNTFELEPQRDAAILI